MANSPSVKLHYQGACPNCGIREVQLPAALADTGDDFDWQVRDYDGFRLFMLAELAARFPERKRWTPADLEVALVEVMATILDQLSDMTDRVAAEAYLETANRPATVRQLLNFIGYDAIALANAKNQIPNELNEDLAIKALEDFWRSNPHAMKQAKRAGPREIHTQKRMVTVDDYAIRLREHPLVVHAHANSEWSGSWFTVIIAVITRGNNGLDLSYPLEHKEQIVEFHQALNVTVPLLEGIKPPTIRMILRPYIDALRMVGQEVLLQDPIYIGIYMSISVKIASNFFQSELRHTITQILGHGPSGFFEAGQQGFGEDLYASDIIAALMSLDGVDYVCLNRFKRIGSQYPDRAEAGFIPLEGLEVALCNNDSAIPSNGYYRLKLQGGNKG